MLRITQSKLNEETDQLLLEGRLVGPWVDELKTVTDKLATRIRLNLSGLTFADADGLALLARLVEQGVEIGGCSGFVAAILLRNPV